MTLKQRLWDEFGPVMDARGICKILHYKSLNALNAANCRGTLPFGPLSIEGRRGIFALTEEIADLVEAAVERRAHAQAASKTQTPHASKEVSM